MMEISDKGLDLIKEFEGFKGQPYLCPAGVPTIGYGTTMYDHGKSVTLADDAISEEYASELLRAQVDEWYGSQVNNLTFGEMTQGEFDALVSFTYNLGSGNLSRSTLLKKFNAGDHAGAHAEFPKWNKAGGKVLAGLTRRRKAEADLFIA